MRGGWERNSRNYLNSSAAFQNLSLTFFCWSKVNEFVRSYCSHLLCNFSGVFLEAIIIQSNLGKFNFTFFELLVTNKGLCCRVVNLVFGRNLNIFNEYLLNWLSLLENSLEKHDFCFQWHLSVPIPFFPHKLWHYKMVNKIQLIAFYLNFDIK